jgi:lipopolysaccharide transport system permease protein
VPRQQPDNDWTRIIHPRRGWFDINWRELFRYRDLVYLFVQRNFVALYKQTILGPLWFLLQPLFSTIVFTVIFGNIAQISTDGLPRMLFYMAGVVTWNFFSGCLQQTSNTFIANAGLFGKVYFPRLTVPLSLVITSLLQFLIQFGLFLAFWAYFYIQGAPLHPKGWLLFTPVLLAQMAALGLGMGLIVSSLTTRYRDLSFLITFGIQLWMYATPVVYPLSVVPARWQWLMALNPMTAIVETFRYSFLGAGTIRPVYLGLSASVTLVLLALGVLLFGLAEKTFMDTV